MTREELQAAHPGLVAEVLADGRREALARARQEGGAQSRAQGAAAERTRIFSIVTHPEAEGRRCLAHKLAAIPEMTAEGAAELLAGIPRGQAASGGPDAEFSAMMKRLGAAPPVAQASEEEELQAYVARMQAYDEADRAERAGRAPTGEG